MANFGMGCFYHLTMEHIDSTFILTIALKYGLTLTQTH